MRCHVVVSYACPYLADRESDSCTPCTHKDVHQYVFVHGSTKTIEGKSKTRLFFVTLAKFEFFYYTKLQQSTKQTTTKTTTMVKSFARTYLKIVPITESLFTIVAPEGKRICVNIFVSFNARFRCARSITIGAFESLPIVCNMRIFDMVL